MHAVFAIDFAANRATADTLRPENDNNFFMINFHPFKMILWYSTSRRVPQKLLFFLCCKKYDDFCFFLRLYGRIWANF